MKQTKLAQNGSSLLAYAISRFSPEIFSHSIWVRFSKKEVSVSLKVIDDLFSTVKNLQVNDPSAACQVLLICAVYQNYAGQHYNALRTAQQALALAQSCGLSKETIWAMWGSCAISVQRGNYEQAASHLLDLQVKLSEQNEWILAGFVDVVKQSLFQPVKVGTGNNSGLPRDRPFEDLLPLTFDWLQRWGFSTGATESNFGVTSSQSKVAQPLFSNKRWKGHWQSLTLAFQGELKLQWEENDSHPIKRRFSFWGSNLGTLLLSLFGQNIHSKATDDTDDVYQIPNISILTDIKDSTSPNVSPPKVKSPSAIEKVNTNPLSGQATTVIPVAVHMLGTFSMAIRDLILKVPASRGLSVLKYLLLHHKQNIPREVLMDVFWPDAGPESARNNLNVALHSLRQALRKVTDTPVIIHENGAYGLEPSLQVWLDVEEFERCVKAGQRLEARNQVTTAVAEYEAAISLYQGDFLEQSPYEEWTVLERERLRVAYLDTLDHLSQIYFSQERYAACITVCQLILTCDRCREDTHCLLVRCYSRQGQYHLALRQYQICVAVLNDELEVEPGPEMTQLYDRIRHRERV